MPKRKRCDLEEDLGHLMRKMKRLEKKIRHRRSSSSGSHDEDSSLSDPEPRIRSVATKPETPALVLDPDDWSPDDLIIPGDDIVTAPETDETSRDNIPTVSNNETANTVPDVAPGTTSSEPQELDPDVLDILGDDPSLETTYGPNIRTELASRFQHTAQEGLSKEVRKALTTKYPLPANCVNIGAPKINIEIKAALTEISVKRDRGIESKQKQMACAISCLGEVITAQLNLKEKDNGTLQKLMDATRILCDIQHSDSATRKFFILSSLKKDMKEHLTNAKIDSFLFGENLAETLKSARAVNKSGVELRADYSAKKQPRRPNQTSLPKALNRKAPAPAHRQPGAPTRSRGPAAQRMQPPPPLPHAHSSRTSWLPPLPPPPPPMPPPPPPPTARRRY